LHFVHAEYCLEIRNSITIVSIFISKANTNTLSSMHTQPVLFISHGAPTFALEPGLLGPQLRALGERLPNVSAVLVVSAHWQTRGVSVMTTLAPATVHDFGGFPAELYRLQYPAAGAPALAADAARLLAAADFAVSLNDQRGLDHGAWIPLRYLYPQGNVPVFQVSIPLNLDPAAALRLGAALAPLRQRGVLIVGSGGLTHNLHDYFGGAADDPGYARNFAGWIQQRVQAGDVNAITHYRSEAPQAARAHPTEEHFLPLPVALGASQRSDAVTTINGGIDHTGLCMDSFAWGLAT
jgi:4,5-DOPA dioxygenase extradiol